MHDLTFLFLQHFHCQDPPLAVISASNAPKCLKASISMIQVLQICSHCPKWHHTLLPLFGPLPQFLAATLISFVLLFSSSLVYCTPINTKSFSLAVSSFFHPNNLWFLFQPAYFISSCAWACINTSNPCLSTWESSQHNSSRSSAPINARRRYISISFIYSFREQFCRPKQCSWPTSMVWCTLVHSTLTRTTYSTTKQWKLMETLWHSTDSFSTPQYCSKRSCRGSVHTPWVCCHSCACKRWSLCQIQDWSVQGRVYTNRRVLRCYLGWSEGEIASWGVDVPGTCIGDDLRTN